MAVEQAVIQRVPERRDANGVELLERKMQGLSSDPKPTVGVAWDSTFYEIDTGKLWTFSEANINPATENGWWEA